MAQLSCVFYFFITLIIITESANFLDHLCPNTTMFLSNSQYQTNLHTVFYYLTTNATTPSGFHEASAGDGTNDFVYGHFLCRGDQTSSSCHDCVTTATTTDLPNKYCPNKKVATIWYDECIVRYSNESFFGKLDQDRGVYMSNLQDGTELTGNVSQFIDITKKMMINMALRASKGGASTKFAVDAASFTRFESVFGLEQCTPDLTDSACYQCLIRAYASLPTKQGGRVMTPSCVVRYEVYSFFNQSLLPQPPQPSPPATAISPDSTSNPSRGDPNRKGEVSTKVLVATIVVALVVSALLFSICICLFKKQGWKITRVITAENHYRDFTVETLQYDLATLQSATNYFSDENKVGEGGFGGVYKGKLSNGKLIAVKRLSTSSSQGIREFKTEVLLVARLQHRNLVRLLGFCYEEQEKLLVYEYAPNKSLDNFIFDQENRWQLDWPRRYNIIQGIGRGLLYLHHDSQLRIIHRDLKAANVLLDHDMNPKISDFGTSRIFGVDHSQSNYTSRVVGTYGYMAPEYALHGQFSVKSDAYSFGVLVLEIISVKSNGNFHQSGDTDNLLSYARKIWEEGTPLDFVDPTIRDSCVNNNEVMRCLHLGLLCVQESVEARPTMVTVVLTLDSFSVTLPVPEQPGYYARPRLESTLLKAVGSDDSSSKSVRLSVNELSITEPEAR